MPRKHRRRPAHDVAGHRLQEWLRPLTLSSEGEAPPPTILIVEADCFRHDRAPAPVGECWLCDLSRSLP
jgi:hypothetical protein